MLPAYSALGLLVKPVEYYQPRGRLLKGAVGVLLISMLFVASLVFIPFMQAPVLWIFDLVSLIFILWCGLMATLALFVNIPALSIDDVGIRIRVTPFTAVKLPWSGVSSTVIETVSWPMPGGKSVKTRRIAIRPSDYGAVKEQFSFLGRLLFAAANKLNNGCLVFYEGTIDIPLEEIFETMRAHATS
jgi:hypothetical protein